MSRAYQIALASLLIFLLYLLGYGITNVLDCTTLYSTRGKTQRYQVASYYNATNVHTHVINAHTGAHAKVIGSYNLTVSLSPWERTRQFHYQPNCSAVADGDSQEISRIKERLRQRPHKPASSEAVYQWAKNCSAYRKAYKFRNTFVTDEERDYPVAFSIRMHHSVEQAEQLLRHIYAPQNVYCIYIDIKSPEDIHKAMTQVASCFDNVFIASMLKNFYYSTVSHTKSDIRCMKDALARPEKWKYFINLVGEEFPIKTNLELVQVLKGLNGKNGIHSTPLSEFHRKTRFMEIHKINKYGQNLGTGKYRESLPSIKLYKGEEYNLFSRAFVKWAINSTMMKELQKFFSNGTWGSDESLWATLNRNPEAPGGSGEQLVPFAKARIWSIYPKLAKECHTTFSRYHCLLSVSEMKWLLTRPQPFANKFKIDKYPVVLDCLGQVLLKRAASLNSAKSA